MNIISEEKHMNSINFAGKIKRQLFRAYTVIKAGAKYLHRPIYEEHITFDRGGKIVKQIEYNYLINRRKKPLIGEYVHVYDSGKEIEVCYYLPVQNLHRREQNIYDKAGRLELVRSFRPDGRICYENYFDYDEKGRKVEMTDFNHELKIKTFYSYVYDRNGNLWKISVYDEIGNLVRETIHLYNEKKQKIKEVISSRYWVNQETVVYEHDIKGNLIRIKRYESELKEVDSFKYMPFKNGLKKVKTRHRYECDCSGVREIISSMEETKYTYY